MWNSARFAVFDQSACGFVEDPVGQGRESGHELSELRSREHEHNEVAEGSDRGGASSLGDQERDLPE